MQCKIGTCLAEPVVEERSRPSKSKGRPCEPKSHFAVCKIARDSIMSYLVVQTRTSQYKVVPSSTKSYLAVPSHTSYYKALLLSTKPCLAVHSRTSYYKLGAATRECILLACSMISLLAAVVRFLDRVLLQKPHIRDSLKT